MSVHLLAMQSSYLDGTGNFVGQPSKQTGSPVTCQGCCLTSVRDEQHHSGELSDRTKQSCLFACLCFVIVDSPAEVLTILKHFRH